MPLGSEGKYMVERTMERRAGAVGMTAVIMTLYFISPAISAISPAVASLSSSYPGVSPAAIGYVVTITAAFQAVAAVVAGSLMGKKVGYRALAIVSSVLVVVAGCFPFVLADGQGFGALLFSRAVLGIGLGTIMPLSNALVLACFSDEDARSKLIAGGNAMLNIGTIVMNLLGGLLCGFSWQATFLVYAIGIILLVLSVVVMREPAHIAEADSAKSARIGKLPGISFAFIVFFLLMCVVTQPVIVYSSTLLAEAGISNSMVPAVMTSVFSVGGIVVSALFPVLFKKLRNVLMPLGYTIGVLALLACYLGSSADGGNLVLFGIGAFLAGAALLIVTCLTPMVLSQVVAPQMHATAMGLVSFSMAAGTFLSTPFAQLVSVLTGNPDVRMVLLGAAALAVMLVVVTGVTVAGMKRRENR